MLHSEYLGKWLNLSDEWDSRNWSEMQRRHLGAASLGKTRDLLGDHVDPETYSLCYSWLEWNSSDRTRRKAWNLISRTVPYGVPYTTLVVTVKDGIEQPVDIGFSYCHLAISSKGCTRFVFRILIKFNIANTIEVWRPTELTSSECIPKVEII